MKPTISYKAEVTVEVIDVKGNIKTQVTKNAIVRLWEDFITNLLNKSWSAALNRPYWTTAADFIDCIAVGAWYKLASWSAAANEIILPYNPVDWAEASSFYDGCTVYCIKWNNAWTNKAVQSGWYNNSTKKLTLSSSFANVPASWDVYVISPSMYETQLNWEWTQDGNWNTITNTRKYVNGKTIQTNTNEIEYTGQWVEAEGNYVIAECGLFYNVSNDNDGNSSTHTPVWQKLFARATFQNSPIVKANTDIVNIKWKMTIWTTRP